MKQTFWSWVSSICLSSDCVTVWRYWQWRGWQDPYQKCDSTVQVFAISVHFLSFHLHPLPPPDPPLLTPSPPACACPLASPKTLTFCCSGAVVFVCALLTMAACSPPGSPVCQRWLQQNRLWEQPVSLPWSPAPQPEGQPSIQLSPCPAHTLKHKHTNAQPNTHSHKKPTTLTPSPNNPRKQFHLDSGGGPLSPAPSIFPY